MKVDVVVAFYKHYDKWSAVRWGLAQNIEHINHIFLVNDEPWGDEAIFVTDGLPVTLLDHEHDGFGLSKSANQGLEEATTDYVLLLEGDEVLAPGSLARTLKLAKPGRLVCAGKIYINEDWRPDNGAEWRVLRGDHRDRFLDADRFRGPRMWSFCSGGHLLIDLATHTAIGGFNEDFGHGLHDYDYAARWMAQPNAEVHYGDAGFVMHLGDGNRFRDSVVQTAPTLEAFAVFAKSLPPLLGHRYHLGCGNRFRKDCINVDLYPTHGADVCLDARDLSWIPDGSAELITHNHFLEHLPRDAGRDHFEQVADKLAPGGKLEFALPDVAKCARAILDSEPGTEAWTAAIMGLYGEASVQKDENLNLGSFHRWGWSQASVEAVLEEVGLDIEYIGPKRLATFAKWRDLEVVAVKE